MVHPVPEPLLRTVIGAVIRSRRRRHGLTLGELADISGISPQYISEVERGRKEPSSEVLAALTGALHLTLTGLLDDARALTDRSAAAPVRTLQAVPGTGRSADTARADRVAGPDAGVTLLAA